MDYSPPGSSIHGVFQARVLEWVAISFSRGSSQPSDRTRVSSNCRQMFYPLSHQGTHFVDVHYIFIPYLKSCLVRGGHRGLINVIWADTSRVDTWYTVKCSDLKCDFWQHMCCRSAGTIPCLWPTPLIGIFLLNNCNPWVWVHKTWNLKGPTRQIFSRWLRFNTTRRKTGGN